MYKYIILFSLFFSSVVFSKSIEGCYLSKSLITNQVNGESELKTSYINILKNNSQYFIEGIIWGANFHICSIVSPIEGITEPLNMKRVGNKLIYEKSEPEYNTQCKLEISLNNNMLKISDTNNHCASYIFYCGARVSLDGIELQKSSEKCK